MPPSISSNCGDFLNRKIVSAQDHTLKSLEERMARVAQVLQPEAYEELKVNVELLKQAYPELDYFSCLKTYQFFNRKTKVNYEIKLAINAKLDSGQDGFYAKMPVFKVPNSTPVEAFVWKRPFGQITHGTSKRSKQQKLALRDRVTQIDGYKALRARVDRLRQALPEERHFSRQKLHEIIVDGRREFVPLEASVLVDESKPHGFFVLLDRLGSGGYGGVKDILWVDDKDQFHHDKEVVKVVKTARKPNQHRNEPNRNLNSIQREYMLHKHALGRKNIDLFQRNDRSKTYLKMKKAQGDDLDTWFQNKKFNSLSFADRLTIASSIHNQLQQLHEAGYLHCDVKPDNIMLHKAQDGTWQIELVDYGLARDQQDRELKNVGAMVYKHPMLIDRKDQQTSYQKQYANDDWVDTHAEAGVFAFLFDAAGEARAILPKLVLLMLEVPPVPFYDFSASYFDPTVPESCRPLLLSLLQAMEGRKELAPTDGQIAAVLELMQLAISEDQSELKFNKLFKQFNAGNTYKGKERIQSPKLHKAFHQFVKQNSWNLTLDDWHELTEEELSAVVISSNGSSMFVPSTDQTSNIQVARLVHATR